MAESCDFGMMKDKLVRDRLVVGIRDNALLERLQMEAELTLDKAKRLIRQREAIKEQQATLKLPIKEETTLDSIASRGPRRKIPALPPQAVKQTPVQQGCKRCGRGSHPRQSCPARDVCFHCNSRGHYSSQCLSNTVAEPTRNLSELTAQPDDPYPDRYLNTVESISEEAWIISIEINGQPVSVKVDTEAEVTALSDSTWNSLNITAPLEKVEIALFKADQRQLNVLGRKSLSITYQGRSANQNVYIIRDLKNNLLGLPVIRKPEMLLHVYSVNKSIISLYPSLFTGLGTFTQTYTIKLKPNSKPFAINAPRNIPLPLRSKVQSELQCMQHLGVISPVQEPTPWCAAIVVVPKDSTAVWICVDLKLLNESVLCEVHPMPKVETTLAQLSGAKIFSKLDANSGFWQIPLAKESRLLTAFITLWTILLQQVSVWHI